MKKILRYVFLISAALSMSRCFAADGGEVLWWMIFDLGSVSGTYDDKSYTADELGVRHARVRYEGADGRGYLPIIGVLDNGSNVTYAGEPGVAVPGFYYASLGEFTGSAYNFVLELGNAENGSWVRTSMESAAVSYDDLKNQQSIAEWHGMPPVYSTPWTPDSFSVVPEPDGAVLFLLGSALLALRRRSGKGA